MRPSTSRARRPPLRRLRPGLFLRRDPRVWWLVVGLGALTLGAVVSHAVDQAEQARAEWGEVRSVLVAARDLAPGEPLRAGDVDLVDRPRAMVPSSALRALPRTATVGATILAGEVVVAERLADRPLSELAARVPAGQRAVAVPADASAAPPLLVGDRVDVLVALAEATPSGSAAGFVVATDALVVAVDDTAITVAVPRDVAPRLAASLGQGAVTLALVGR